MGETGYAKPQRVREVQGPGRWLLRLVLVLLLGIIIYGAATVVLRGRDWSAAEDRRNYRELQVLGRAIEGWPKAVESMARGNLLPDRLTVPPDAKTARAKWQATATLEHPELGKIYIHYRLDDAVDEACTGEVAPANGINISDSSNLRLNGELPLNAIWDADVGLAQRPSASEEPSAEEYRRLAIALTQTPIKSKTGQAAAGNDETAERPVFADVAPSKSMSCRSIKYQVQIPLVLMANMEANAPTFAAVLMVDPEGNIRATIGTSGIPVTSIGDMVLPGSQVRETVRDLLRGVNKSDVKLDSGDAELLEAYEAQKAGKPFPIAFAGEDFVAYARPLAFPKDWQANDCTPKTKSDATDFGLQGTLAGKKFQLQGAAIQNSASGSSDTNSKSGSGKDAIAPQKNGCMLIGLVKARTVEKRSISLASDELALLALFLTLATVLLPLLKLRLLGPGGYLSAAEVVAALFGLVAAAALATLAVVVLINLQVVHARNHAAIERSATRLADQFTRELDAALSGPYWVPLIRYSDGGNALTKTNVPLASVQTAQDIDCKFDDGTDAGTYTAIAPSGFSMPTQKSAMQEVDNIDEKPRYWPAWEIMSTFGDTGRAFPGYGTLANRCNLGNRGDIGHRDYFRRTLRGESDGPLPIGAQLYVDGLEFSNSRYVIEAVRAQGDGVIKVIAAVRFNKPAGAKHGGPQSGVLIRTMVPRSLLLPVLPRGHKFIVVDAGKPDLPYVFGSAPHRVGIDQLDDAFDSGLARAKIAAAKHDAQFPKRTGEPQKSHTFTALFEGSNQQFVAQGIPNTPWVLLVHRSLDEIDTGLASALALAAAAWFFVTFSVAMIVALGWPWLTRQTWIILWPRPGGGKQARSAALWIAFATALACVLLVLSWKLAWGPIAAIAVVLPLVALAIAWGKLGNTTGGGDKHEFTGLAEMLRTLPARVRATIRRHSKPDVVGNLKPSDERGYGVLIVALLLAIGVVPMCALWVDAHATMQAREAEDEIRHLERAWKANRDAVKSQIKMMGLWDYTPSSSDAVEMDADLGTPGWAGGELGPIDHAAWVENALVSKWLQDWAGLGAVTGAPSCTRLAMAADGAKMEPYFCVGDKGQVGLDKPDGLASWEWHDVSRPDGMAILIAIVLLIYLIFLAQRTLKRGLFGFATPLEAVTYPGIDRKDGSLSLPERAVVLNGPLALALELLETEDPFDLGNIGSEPSAVSHPRLVHYLRLIRTGGTVMVTGLDVALKDPALRLMALAALEELSEEIDKARRHLHPKGKLIVLTDLSPLDRILQAYERERDADAHQAPPISRSEQLRWSRLFEDFSTITMRPVTKYALHEADQETLDTKLEEGRAKLATMPGKRAEDLNDNGIRTLVEELQRLPEAAIDSLLEPWDWDLWIKAEERIYPLETADYSEIYFLRVVAWAIKVNPVTREAAIDFLRGALIEHYQHIWAASSHSERLILDNLARGRMVNIRSALAIRSLIRRGIVVLDPLPRLMNESFAAFVRQAERPETIVHWRTELPRSGWDKVARPLALIVPVLTIGIVALAAVYGEGIETILPVILGTGPALVTTMFGLRRSS